MSIKGQFASVHVLLIRIMIANSKEFVVDLMLQRGSLPADSSTTLQEENLLFFHAIHGRMGIWIKGKA